jgi:hypothetical protein
MYSRRFEVAVIVLWLSAMSWLVTKKVLPPLLVGQPPNYRTILQAQQSEPPVGWTMNFKGRQLGWAVCDTFPMPDGLTEVRSRVHFDSLPLGEMMPGWFRVLMRLIEQPISELKMDTRSVLTIDSLGRLWSFESKVRLDPIQEVVTLRGKVEENRLTLSFHSGGLSYENPGYIPANALLGDALSPQTQLPGLRQGQTWTFRAFSPLRPPKAPLEVLQATVEGLQQITWNGHAEEVWLVVYRSDPGLGLGSDKSPRGRLWVRRDGTVLKQQVTVFDSKMTFVRMPDDQAMVLAGDMDEISSPKWKSAEGLREAASESWELESDFDSLHEHLQWLLAPDRVLRSRKPWESTSEP